MGIMAAIAFRTDQLDMALFAAALAGGCIGFIWFNCYPADIFMGDTGSLALGAALAAIAVMTKTELFSLIIGGIFIIEAFGFPLRESPPFANACSSWRRSIIISRRKDGRRPRSSSASGS